MTKKKLVVALCFLGTAGIATAFFVDRSARACSDCDNSAANVAVQPTPSPESHEGHSCTLDPLDQERAMSELAEFNKTFLNAVETSISASYVGDKATIEPVLAHMIARETGCCSHLTFSKEETERGYQVTVTGNRAAIAELQAILSVSRAKP